MTLFKGQRYTLISPPRFTQATAAGTETEFSETTRAFICSTAGSLICRFANDTADQTLEVVAGVQYSAALTHVRSGSTAEIVGMW